MRKLTIFDVDNCISDDGYRIPAIRWDVPAGFHRWHNYHLMASFDRPGNRHLMRGLQADDIIIFTAMPEHYRAARLMWFNYHRIGFRKMYMRPDDNHLHSSELKRWMLQELYADMNVGPENIRVAYDDREEVVSAYAAEGINAELVKIHNVCAYTAPKLEK